jgi:hypothetical protein
MRIGKKAAVALAVVGVVGVVVGGRAVVGELQADGLGAGAGAGDVGAGGAGTGDAGAGDAGAVVTPSASPVVETDRGWRWESYGTVKVQVPDRWEDTVYSGIWSCGDQSGPMGGNRTPLVGRPWRGPVPAIGCPQVPVPAERVPHLWFDDFGVKPGITRFDHGWVSEVRVVNGVSLSVFSDDDVMRRRVLDSAVRTGSTDPKNGCSVARPAVLGDGQRPTGPGLAAIGAVTSIRVCAYSYQLPSEPSVQGRPPDLRRCRPAAG